MCLMCDKGRSTLLRKSISEDERYTQSIHVYQRQSQADLVATLELLRLQIKTRNGESSLPRGQTLCTYVHLAITPALCSPLFPEPGLDVCVDPNPNDHCLMPSLTFSQRGVRMQHKKPSETRQILVILQV